MTAGRTNTDQQSRDWCTPRKYIAAVREVLDGRIDLDPCSNLHSLVGATIAYSLPMQDGLAASWAFKRIYVNPPYGADRSRGTRISDWLARCLDAHVVYGAEVLALIPVAPNTQHWKKYIWGHAEAVCFLADTRLKFNIAGREDTKGAPMACCMVYWGKNRKRFDSGFSPHGAIVFLDNQRVKPT